MKMTDAEIKAQGIAYIADSKDSSSAEKQKERATEYQDFFRGHHWTKAMYDIYKSKGVDPVTINRCKPVIKSLLGMYLDNRQAISVMPRKGRGIVQDTAQVWTEIMKHTQEVSHCDDGVYPACFMRGAIDSESYLKLVIDQGMNINGQPKIELRTMRNIDIDRSNRKYDLNGGRFVIDKDWKDKEWVKARYPDMKSEVDEAVASFDSDALLDRLSGYMAGEEDDTERYQNAEEYNDSEYLKKYKYLLRYVYWKECISAVVVADKQEERVQIVTDEKKIEKLRRKGKKSERFNIINYPIYVLHETTFMGSLMLEDVENPLGEGVSEFPIVRYSPMWDDGYAVGALDDAVQLNSEENIHRTQFIKLLNQTANSGWIVADGTNKKYMALLANYGSVDGIVIDKAKCGGGVEKIKPTPPPEGFFAMGQQFEMDVKRTTQVDDATQGYDTGRAESGRAIGFKREQNQASNDPFFDNFYHTLGLMGELLLKVLRKNNYYTDREIRAIVSSPALLNTEVIEKAQARLEGRLGAGLPEPMPMPPLNPQILSFVRPEDKIPVMRKIKAGQQAFMQYQKAYPGLKRQWDAVIREEAIETMLQELKKDEIAEYSVKVTVSPSAPTQRLKDFLMMSQIQDRYGIIPPDVFIEATDLPQKEEIKAKMNQMQQAQAQMPQGGRVAG